MKSIGILLVAAALMAAAALGATRGAASAHPTCTDLLGTEVHGQHIVGDYVTGVGGISGVLTWPPAGQVGEAVQLNGGGAAVPGGPGPGFHFPNGVAPGASFCNEQAHPGGFDIPGPHSD